MSNISVDEQLLAHIVNTYSDTILRIAYQHTKNIYDSQDIAQEVYLAVLKKDISNYNEDHLKACIIRTAINKCKDFHKSRRRKNVISLEDAQPLFSPEEQSIIDEVCSLPKKYRNVIYLYYYEGYLINEIAEITNTKPNTVSSQLHRGRVLLKKILTEENYE